MPRRALESKTGPNLWILRDLPERSAQELEHWLGHLAELSLDRWCAIGRACGNDNPDRSAALAALDATIDWQRLGVTAWYIRDLVSTAVYAVRREAEHASRVRRRQFCAAIAAAESTALTIAAQEWLSAADYACLRAAFPEPSGANELRLL